MTVVVLAALAAHGCTVAEDASRDTGELVAALERYLVSGAGDVRRLTAGARGPAAELTATRENVVALGITDLRLRHRGPSSTSQAHAGDGAPARAVDVEMTWRLTDHDDAAATLVVPVEVVQRGDATAFRTARLAGDRRVPLWLLAPLTVRRSAGGVVAAVEPGQAAPVARMVDRASRAVRAAVPSWRGTLVVEVPATQEQYAASTGSDLPLDAGPERVAVTTTADGRRTPLSPTRIHLHPESISQLGPRAQQVVVTHEAAHVALGSPVRSAPAWLAEGIADHVALAGSGIPVADAAAQAVAMVRREGLPSALPTDEQLAGASGDAGAWYEAAWLAVRALVEEYGEPAVLTLYEATAGTVSAARTLPEVLGTTENEVVVAWRRELARLAGLAG